MSHRIVLSLPLFLTALAAPAWPQGASMLDDPGPYGFAMATVGPLAGPGTVSCSLTFTPYFATQPETVVLGPSPGVDGLVFHPLGAPGERFPLVHLLHGFGADALDYTYLGLHLASWGFFVVAVDLDSLDNPAISPFHEAVDALELAAYVETLPQFADMIDAGRQAAVGHSLGAAAAMLVPHCASRVETVVAMTPAVQQDLVDLGFLPFFTYGLETTEAALPGFAGGLFQVVAELDGLIADPEGAADHYGGLAPLARHNAWFRVDGALHAAPADFGTLFQLTEGWLFHRVALAALRSELYGEEDRFRDVAGQNAHALLSTHLSFCKDPVLWTSVVGTSIEWGILGVPGDDVAFYAQASAVPSLLDIGLPYGLLSPVDTIHHDSVGLGDAKVGPSGTITGTAVEESGAELHVQSLALGPFGLSITRFAHVLIP